MGESRAADWFKGCAIGCGGLLILFVLLLVGGTMRVMRPMSKAIDAREMLEQRIGPAAAFTPQADGSVPPERVEAFLQVREAIAEGCRGIEKRSSDLLRMEEFDGVEEPPRMEILRAGLAASGAAMSLPRLIGQLHLQRNRALLEADMGFGEYVYVYLTAYHHRLADLPGDAGLFGPDPITPAVHEDLVPMLQRQAETLRSQGGDGDGLAALELEIAAVQRDRDRLPWADGLPHAVEASYVPFRQRLDELFCPTAAGIELLRNTRRGLSIQSR